MSFRVLRIIGMMLIILSAIIVALNLSQGKSLSSFFLPVFWILVGGLFIIWASKKGGRR